MHKYVKDICFSSKTIVSDELAVVIFSGEMQ